MGTRLTGTMAGGDWADRHGSGQQCTLQRTHNDPHNRLAAWSPEPDLGMALGIIGQSATGERDPCISAQRWSPDLPTEPSKF